MNEFITTQEAIDAQLAIVRERDDVKKRPAKLSSALKAEARDMIEAGNVLLKRRHELFIYGVQYAVDIVLMAMCAQHEELSTKMDDYAPMKKFLDAIPLEDYDNVICLDDKAFAKLVGYAPADEAEVDAK